MYQNHTVRKICKWKNSLGLLRTWNKNGFFRFVMKNNANGTNHTNTIKNVDSLNDCFANICESSALGLLCSILGDMIKPKSIEKTTFLYPKDANEVYSLIKDCKVTNLTDIDGLSNDFLKIAGPVKSDFLAVIFQRCIQVGYFPNILKNARTKPFFNRWHAKPQKLLSNFIVIIVV